MSNYQLLPKLTIPLFNNEYNITDTPFGHHKLDVSNLSAELLDFFKERNVYPSHVGSFRWQANFTTPIHTDNKPRGIVHDTVKLNWVIGGKDSCVNWYQPIDYKILIQEYLSPAKRTLPGGKEFEDYTHHDENNCKLIESASVSGVLIMQAGIPHNVVNPTEERYCFSIVLMHIDTNTNLSMKDAKEIFSDLI
jgi:hypothetical protein